MSKDPSPSSRKDRLVGLVWFFLGVAILLASISSLRVGSASEPGPGLFPFLAGLSVMAFSVVVLVNPRPSRGAAPDAAVQAALQWKKVVYTVVALLGYALLLEKAGFLLTTWLLFVFLLRNIEPQGWKTVIGVSILSSLGSYLFFDRILCVQLPRGLLSFF